MRLLADIGLFTDHAFPMLSVDTFWSTPLGLALTSILCISSFIIMHTCKNVWDEIYYGCMGVVFSAALLVGIDDRNPHHIVKTLLFIMTVRYLQLALAKIFKIKKKEATCR